MAPKRRKRSGATPAKKAKTPEDPEAIEVVQEQEQEESGNEMEQSFQRAPEAIASTSSGHRPPSPFLPPNAADTLPGILSRASSRPPSEVDHGSVAESVDQDELEESLNTLKKTRTRSRTDDDDNDDEAEDEEEEDVPTSGKPKRSDPIRSEADADALEKLGQQISSRDSRVRDRYIRTILRYILCFFKNSFRLSAS
jgi:hypothetical protein